MADVAARAGVSIATVSRALRDVKGVSPATRERVREIAAELSYVVSPEASALARKAKGRIAVVVPRIDIWFYSAMLAGIEECLRAEGVDTLVYQVHGEAQRSRFFEELPARRKVDAVVLVALPMTHAEVGRLDTMGVHVVVAGGRVRDLPRVDVDELGVTRTAIEHLLGLGHRRIAMLRTDDTEGTSWSSDVARRRGFQETMAARGLPVPDDYIVTEPYGPTAGVHGMERILQLDPRPTAVFAFSDEIAIGALQTLGRRGIAVPGGMSVIGVDGHPLAEAFRLTTVSQRVEAQGRRAGQMAIGLVRGVEQRVRQVVQAELVVRGSTGPPGG